MYCQCGRGSRSTEAARVRYGSTIDRESAENMNLGWSAAKRFCRATVMSNSSKLEK
jgi:hypothetical protein